MAYVTRKLLQKYQVRGRWKTSKLLGLPLPQESLQLIFGNIDFFSCGRRCNFDCPTHLLWLFLASKVILFSKVETLRRSYRDLPFGHWPPLSASAWTWFWPDSDLIWTWDHPFQVRIRSKSGQNQVQAEGFRAGRCQRGGSGWGGPCSSSESLYSKVVFRSARKIPFKTRLEVAFWGYF